MSESVAKMVEMIRTEARREAREAFAEEIIGKGLSAGSASDAEIRRLASEG